MHGLHPTVRDIEQLSLSAHSSNTRILHLLVAKVFGMFKLHLRLIDFNYMMGHGLAKNQPKKRAVVGQPVFFTLTV